jgi:hypothetical protein
MGGNIHLTFSVALSREGRFNQVIFRCNVTLLPPVVTLRYFNPDLREQKRGFALPRFEPHVSSLWRKELWLTRRCVVKGRVSERNDGQSKAGRRRSTDETATRNRQHQPDVSDE